MLRSPLEQARTRKARRANKANQRGAALVEAAVVLPCMLVFLGCIMFAHDSYDAKMDIQMQTRAGVMYYASHGCAGGVPAELASPGTAGGYASPYGIVNNPANGAIGKLDAQNNATLSTGLSTAYNTARAERVAPTITRKTVFNGESSVLTRPNIRAGSLSGCNEHSAPSNWVSAIFAVAGFAQGGGGFP